MSISLSLPITTNTVTIKPKRDLYWLKDHQFKKGHSGKPKGATKRLLEITKDAIDGIFLINPKTGKHWSNLEEFQKYWAMRIGSDSRICIELWNRKFGKPAEKVEQAIQFVIRMDSPKQVIDVSPDKVIFALPETKQEDNGDNSST